MKYYIRADERDEFIELFTSIGFFDANKEFEDYVSYIWLVENNGIAEVNGYLELDRVVIFIEYDHDLINVEELVDNLSENNKMKGLFNLHLFRTHLAISNP